MSGQALGWAKRREVGTRAERSLLILLADSHDDSHGFAWPSIGTLAQYGMMSPRHVKRLLRGFVLEGVLLGYHVIDRLRGNQLNSAYWFPIEASEPTAQQIAAYELQVRGLLVRWTPKGADAPNVTPPTCVSDVTGGVTPGVTGGVTPGVTPKLFSLTPPKTSPQCARASFAEAWAAYPDKGKAVSSEREGEAAWAAEFAGGADPLRMIAAAKAYAADKRAWGASGQPLSFHKFFASGRWVRFAELLSGDSPAEACDVVRQALDGWPAPEAELRADFESTFGPAAAASWFAQGWREADRTLIAKTSTARDWLRREARGWLQRRGLKVISAAEAGEASGDLFREVG